MILQSVFVVLLLEEINAKDDCGESPRITLSTLLAGGSGYSADSNLYEIYCLANYAWLLRFIWIYLMALLKKIFCFKAG